MSEIGFTITTNAILSDDERERLRSHYLTYARAERDERRTLHDDLDAIYSNVDRLADSGDLLRLVNALEECRHIVVFATEASTLALREFQQAMLAEGKIVRMVSETSADINGIAALGPDDVLITVTTSNGFARRQRKLIERSGAYRVIITASKDDELHALFDDVLSIGEGAEEGGSLHRIYATFGVTYFFDRLFTQFARAFDPGLK